MRHFSLLLCVCQPTPRDLIKKLAQLCNQHTQPSLPRNIPRVHHPTPTKTKPHHFLRFHPPPRNLLPSFQIQVGAPGSSGLQYHGPVDCAVKLVKAEGIGALFRGASVTAIRDTPSLGIYFASYEGFKERLMMPPRAAAESAGGGPSAGRWGLGLGEQASSFWAGGLAGALSWFVIYPFDVVKSIQQVRCCAVQM